MKRRHTVAEWRAEVFKAAPGIVSDSTRVLLLYLADHMREDLSVSVPRARIAKDLGRSERRIAERFREAVGEAPGQDPSKRLLDRKVRGTKHSQAVYVALMPDAVNMTPSRQVENEGQHDGPEHVEKAEIRHVENGPLSVNPDSQHDTRGSRLTTAEPSRGVENRNGGNDEESAAAGVSSAPVVCRWHPDEPCPADCANAPETNRRRTA